MLHETESFPRITQEELAITLKIMEAFQELCEHGCLHSIIDWYPANAGYGLSSRRLALKEQYD